MACRAKGFLQLCVRLDGELAVFAPVLLTRYCGIAATASLQIAAQWSVEIDSSANFERNRFVKFDKLSAVPYVSAPLGTLPATTSC